jgi:UDP-glucose 4-epimerase
VPPTTIAITGASGFLGSALLPHLHQAGGGYSFRALTRTLHAEQASPPSGVSWMQGDLVSPRACAELVEDADVVIHLAHVNTPLTSDAHLPSDAAANLVPMLNLLQAIRSAKRRPHVVLASSGGALYRGADERQPLSESAPTLPVTSYGVQKLAQEHYLRIGAEQGWLTATVLRIGNPYGILLPPERRQGFIGVALNSLREGRPIRIFGNEENVRDYIHLDDMCRMFELVLEPKDGFDVVNVGSGKGHSVREIVDLIERIADQPVPVERVPSDDAAERLPGWVVLKIEKAGRVFGWRPTIAFEDGVRRLCEEALGG